MPEAGALIEDASVAVLKQLSPGPEPPRPTVSMAGKPWDMGSAKASKV